MLLLLLPCSIPDTNMVKVPYNNKIISNSNVFRRKSLIKRSSWLTSDGLFKIIIIILAVVVFLRIFFASGYVDHLFIFETTTTTTKEAVITSQYYNVSQIVKFQEPLVRAPQTVVTAYFQIRSKHSSDKYNTWITNMLSLQDPMVIFLSPALIPQIKELRKHALNRTVIIPMEISDVPLARNYNASFWEHQFDIDREKRIHRSYQVFWIWLSKSWWVVEAIRHNFFHSQVFVWSDMGCFRNTAYNNKEMVQHPETVPRRAMLFLAHHDTNPPPTRIWNSKHLLKPWHFYHSGSIMAGYGDTFQQFHQQFMVTMDEFLTRNMFIGEDQLVMQSACLLNPQLCAYIKHTDVRDNYYFGLRYVLHHGGQYDLWYPPGLDEPLPSK